MNTVNSVMSANHNKFPSLKNEWTNFKVIKVVKVIFNFLILYRHVCLQQNFILIFIPADKKLQKSKLTAQIIR